MPSDPTTTVARQVAERAEASRLSEHRQAMQSMRLLAQPLEPPDPVLVIDAKMAQLDVVFVRDWEESEAEAQIVYCECLAKLEDARTESVRLAEAKAGHPV